MSTELIIALCAVAGVLGTIGAGLVKFGTMSQRLDQLEKDDARLEAMTTNVQMTLTSKMDRLIEGIDEKLDRIWEYLHQISSRRRNDSKPPLGDD